MTISLPQLAAAAPSCDLCLLHEQGDGIPKSVGIPTRGLHTSVPPAPDVPAIVYVGRNSGPHEDAQNEAFVGKSGELLQSAIIGGISAQAHASIYLTNAVRCYTVNNDSPPAKAYSACASYLAQDLLSIFSFHNEASARVLVLLGGEAVKYVHERILGVKGINLKKGFNEQLQEYSRIVDPEASHLPAKQRNYIDVPAFRVVCMYHPSFLLRNPNAIHPTVGHNQLVSDALQGISSAPSPPVIEACRPPRA